MRAFVGFVGLLMTLLAAVSVSAQNKVPSERSLEALV
jgi:hypothetical protein